MAPQFRIAVWLARIAACLAVAAAVAACRTQATGSTRDARREATALVLGVGGAKVCRTDGDCAPLTLAVAASEVAGKKSNVTPGTCVMGSCFGLVTTDSRAARRVLADRLGQADPDVQAAAESVLLAEILAPPGPGRLGVVEGMGAILAARGTGLKPDTCAREPMCTALRAEATSPDERLATAARLALGRAGDASVRPALVEDTRLGTEQLRLEATLALGHHLAGSDAAGVVAALLARLDDDSAQVQEAAVRALAPLAARPDVAAALAGLRQGRSAHLRYTVDRTLEQARAKGID